MPRAKFEYEYQDTFMHKMHPVTKFGIFVSISIACSCFLNPIYTVVPIAIGRFLWWKAKVPNSWNLIPIIWIVISNINPFGAITTTYPFMFNPGLYRVADPIIYGWLHLWDINFLTYPLLRLDIPPIIQQIFGMPALAIYCPGALLHWLNAIMAQFGTSAMATSLYYSTSIPDLVQFLLKYKMPNLIIFPVVTIFRFFPVLSELSSQIVNSQTLRGLPLTSRNPYTMMKRMTNLMEPIGRTFIKTNDLITIAVVNRAFGAGQMVPHREQVWPLYEKVLVVVFLVVAVGSFLLATGPMRIGQL